MDFKNWLKAVKKGIKAKAPKPKKLSQVRNFSVEFVGNTFEIRDGYLILKLDRDRKEVQQLKPLGDHTAGIDLGLDNFLALKSHRGWNRDNSFKPVV